MKNILPAIALATLFASCTNQPTPQNPITGQVIDATMNSLMVVTAKNDTMNFSTIELGDAGKQISVFLGDSISIAYKNVESQQDIPSYLSATQMTLVYRSPSQYIIGDWVEPNPIDSTAKQGFKFNADGTAATIGMATLECSQWQLSGDSLTMTVTSVGVKQPSTTDITYAVKTLDNTSLVLCQDQNVVFNLSRLQ